MKLDFEDVTVAGVAKSYGATLALARVDMTFQQETVTVIRGANGSGKSTLLWLLALLAHPTRGEIRYGGHGTERGNELRGRIGFVAHQLQLYPGLSGRENLMLAAQLFSIIDAPIRTLELARDLDLEEFWDRPVRTYSRGQAQRVAIARAILHRPRLLLMDEPSTGLDQRSADTLRAMIATQKAEGAIVVVVTHEMSFAEAVGDRVFQIERGRVVEHGS